MTIPIPRWWSERKRGCLSLGFCLGEVVIIVLILRFLRGLKPASLLAVCGTAESRALPKNIHVKVLDESPSKKQQAESISGNEKSRGRPRLLS